jgi:hypothetical protein
VTRKKKHSKFRCLTASILKNLNQSFSAIIRQLKCRNLGLPSLTTASVVVLIDIIKSAVIGRVQHHCRVVPLCFVFFFLRFVGGENKGGPAHSYCKNLDKEKHEEQQSTHCSISTVVVAHVTRHLTRTHRLDPVWDPPPFTTMSSPKSISPNTGAAALRPVTRMPAYTFPPTTE